MPLRGAITRMAQRTITQPRKFYPYLLNTRKYILNTNNSNNTNGADVKSAKGMEIYNCCFEPAYTIQHIVEAMKKVTGLTQFVPDIPNWVIMPMARAAMLLGSPMGICPARVKKLQISTNICGEKLKNCGYQFKWSFEEALADWFEDNDRKYLK